MGSKSIYIQKLRRVGAFTSLLLLFFIFSAFSFCCVSQFPFATRMIDYKLLPNKCDSCGDYDDILLIILSQEGRMDTSKTFAWLDTIGITANSSKPIEIKNEYRKIKAGESSVITTTISDINRKDFMISDHALLVKRKKGRFSKHNCLELKLLRTSKLISRAGPTCVISPGSVNAFSNMLRIQFKSELSVEEIREKISKHNLKIIGEPKNMKARLSIATDEGMGAGICDIGREIREFIIDIEPDLFRVQKTDY